MRLDLHALPPRAARLRLPLGLLLASGLLAACGGGDGSDPLTAEAAVRSADPAVFTAFVAAEAALPASETTEPLSLDAVADRLPPTSETAEPAPI